MHQLVRSFPQITLRGSPKLSEVSQRAEGTSVWASEKGVPGQVQTQTHKDVLITCELDGLGLPTMEARALLCSQMLLLPTGWGLQT